MNLKDEYKLVCELLNQYKDKYIMYTYQKEEPHTGTIIGRIMDIKAECNDEGNNIALWLNKGCMYNDVQGLLGFECSVSIWLHPIKSAHLTISERVKKSLCDGVQLKTKVEELLWHHYKKLMERDVKNMKNIIKVPISNFMVLI